MREAGSLFQQVNHEPVAVDVRAHQHFWSRCLARTGIRSSSRPSSRAASWFALMRGRASSGRSSRCPIRYPGIGGGLFPGRAMDRLRELPGRDLWRSRPDGSERKQLTYAPFSRTCPAGPPMAAGSRSWGKPGPALAGVHCARRGRRVKRPLPEQPTRPTRLVARREVAGVRRSGGVRERRRRRECRPGAGSRDAPGLGAAGVTRPLVTTLVAQRTPHRRHVKRR